MLFHVNLISEIRHNIERMGRDDVVKSIAHTRHKVVYMNRQLQRLNDDIIELQTGFQGSRSLSFYRRYTTRKELLKEFFRVQDQRLWNDQANLDANDLHIFQTFSTDWITGLITFHGVVWLWYINYVKLRVDFSIKHQMFICI